MAAKTSKRFFSFFFRKSIEGQSNGLPALYILPWCRSCVVQHSRGLHTSEFLCGGRPKSEWRRKRVPALTKLCPDKSEKFKTRKAFGGGRKTKVTRAKQGLYIWKSQDVEFQTPILDVLCNTAHKDFTEKKIMVKGTIVEVDGEKFKSWYETESKETEMQEVQGQLEDIDKVLQQLEKGKVLAKVSSRPGQEGKVNGYLLEGEELDRYLNQTSDVTHPVLGSQTWKP